MRGRRKFSIWPAYFDLRYTRGEGRRVSREKAVRDPPIKEIENAATQLGLKPILESNATYPKHPWKQTGVILVDNKEPKTQIIHKIAEKLRNKK